jgi:uncharacterized protein (DUF433 family)
MDQTTTPHSAPKNIAVSCEHIETTPQVCGGKPRIAGTRIRVQDVYVWHELQGQSADEIVSNFPHLTLADVYAALAYYWDHRDQIQQQMKAEDALVEAMKLTYPSKLPEKLKARDAADSSLPSR